jgi:hypothetical protein
MSKTTARGKKKNITMQEHQSDYRLREMEGRQAQMFTTDRVTLTD